MATDVKPRVEVHRQLPVPIPENSDGPLRGGRYLEAYVQNVVPTKHVLADEGSYFVATNATPGTGVTYSTVAGASSFVDTVGMFVFKNNDNAGNPKAKRMYLDYLRLICTTAGLTTTSMQFAVKLDNVNRVPTAGGTTALVPVNVNMDDGTSPISQVWAFSAAALTVPASGGSARLAARTSIATSQSIAGDEYLVQFGPVDHHGAIQGLTAARATAVGKMTTTAPPIVIGPQQFVVVHMWWLAVTGTAPAFEYELGWWER